MRANTAPIGVFDSGVGGLTVLRELLRRFPQESFIYLGDLQRLPYGSKPPSAVLRYAEEGASFLIEQGVKLLVIACHTASAHALETLQASLPIPVLGMIQPSITAASQALERLDPQSRRLALLGTSSTIASNLYQTLLQKQHPLLHIHAIACPLFVPLVEEGLFDLEIARWSADHYLSPLKSLPIQAVLLACTHYPLLRPAIQAILGPSARLIEPAAFCAEEVEQMLLHAKLKTAQTNLPTYRFCTTENPERFAVLARLFLGMPLQSADIEQVDLNNVIHQTLRPSALSSLK